MLVRNDTTDIVSVSTKSDFVICGFFTPDYRPLASVLADSLASLHPFHLFAVPKDGLQRRDILHMKPQIILRAMELYPQAAVVFLDIDCTVRGPIDEIANFPGDVSAYVKLRKVLQMFPFLKRTTIAISSRSMVFKPNERVRRFLRDWHSSMTEGPYVSAVDETALTNVLLTSHYVSFSPMDRRFSGREIDKATDMDVVVHESASRKKRQAA